MLYGNVHWFRGLADGCNMLDEVLERIETRKNRIIRLKEIGCTIKYSHDDYMLLEIPESAVESYCHLMDMKPEELFVIREGV